jgi:hypothetical protein
MMIADMARLAVIFGGTSRDNEEGESGGRGTGLIAMSRFAPRGDDHPDGDLTDAGVCGGRDGHPHLR